MNFIVFIIGLALLAYAILSTASKMAHYGRAVRYAEATDAPKPAKPKVARKTLIALIGLAIMLVAFSFTIVPTGYTGVRTTFGLIDQEACKPGFNVVVPFVQNISLVNNKQQDLTFPDRVNGESKEQVVTWMENVQVVYRVNPEYSAWIFANVENWVQDLVDSEVVASAMREATRQLSVNVVTDRGIIEPIAKEMLQQGLNEKYGENMVEVKTVIINNMGFDDDYDAAIAEKSRAVQEQQKKAIQNQTAIDEAKAKAESARAIAQGNADAARIEAEGKAEANRILVESITNQTQLQDIIAKWNGELPKYTGAGDGLFGIVETAVAGD